MKQLLIKVLVFAGLMVSIFAYGFLAGKYQWPPYAQLKQFQLMLSPPDTPEPELPYDIDVPSLIRVHDPEALAAKRARLIEILFGTPILDQERLPDAVIPNITDETYADLPNLASIDRLETRMEYGIESIGYYFKAD